MPPISPPPTAPIFAPLPASPAMAPMAAPPRAPRAPPRSAPPCLASCEGGALVLARVGSKPLWFTAQMWHSPRSLSCCAWLWPFCG